MPGAARERTGNQENKGRETNIQILPSPRWTRSMRKSIWVLSYHHCFFVDEWHFLFLQANEDHFEPACTYWDGRWIFQKLRWFQGSILALMLVILRMCSCLNQWPLTSTNLFILFFFLSAWSKDGCKVEETSKSKTVSKCTHFSTFAVIMKVKEKVMGSIYAYAIRSCSIFWYFRDVLYALTKPLLVIFCSGGWLRP